MILGGRIRSMASPRDLGIDLGTANSLVVTRDRGVVLREPSVVALDGETRRVLAVGEEARRMLGRTPGNIIALRPLRDGVIADYEVTELMLRVFIRRAAGRSLFFRPRIVVCVPSGVTSVERRAVVDAVLQAGARQAYVMEEPVAAALGAGLDIAEPRGNMVVDIGGGTSDVAVLSLGGIVASRSIRVGGDALDAAIVRYARQEFNLLIGERTAEELKMQVGTACMPRQVDEYEVRGRDLVSGLPRNLVLTSAHVHEAMKEPLAEIVGAVKAVLEQTPPELAADIIDRGIVLTGGGALLKDMDVLLSRETGVPVHIAEHPLDCVALGTLRALGSLDRLPLYTR